MMERIHKKDSTPCPATVLHDPSQKARLTSAENALIACQQTILLGLNAVMHAAPEVTGQWGQLSARIQDLENHLAAVLASGAKNIGQTAWIDHMLCDIRQMSARSQP